MGFSYYWKKLEELDKETFKLWTEYVRKIIMQADKEGIILAEKALGIKIIETEGFLQD